MNFSETLVYLALKRWGPMTDDELWTATRFSPRPLLCRAAVSRNRRRLRESGLVRDTGERVTNCRGRGCARWAVA